MLPSKEGTEGTEGTGMPKKFDEEEGSIAHKLSDLDSETRKLYHKNRAEFYADLAALRQWESHGCVSGYEVIGSSGGFVTLAISLCRSWFSSRSVLRVSF